MINLLEDPYLKEIRHAAKTFCGQMKEISCLAGSICYYGQSITRLCICFQALCNRKKGGSPWQSIHYKQDLGTFKRGLVSPVVLDKAHA